MLMIARIPKAREGTVLGVSLSPHPSTSLVSTALGNEAGGITCGTSHCQEYALTRRFGFLWAGRRRESAENKLDEGAFDYLSKIISGGKSMMDNNIATNQTTAIFRLLTPKYL